MNTEEEFFCLKYELTALRDYTLHHKNERWIYGFIDKITEKEHLDRYKFASTLVKDKTVLDIACGSGLGGYILSKDGQAKKVVGVDLDKDSIRYGNFRYALENISRYAGDATTYKGEELFDVIVSFETIEHVPDYNKLLDNFSLNLKDGGILIISTPINRKTTTELINPYHVIEWSFNDFHSLLKNNFDIIEVYVQNIRTEREKEKTKINPLTKLKFKLRPDLEKNFHEKIKIKSIGRGKEFEKFEGQYDINTITNGYQLLVASKKRHPSNKQ